MKNLKFISFTFLTVLIISCEGNTDRYRHVQNNTNESINIYASGISFYDFEFNETLTAGQSVKIFQTYQRGGSDYVENPAIGIDSLLITNSNGDTCTKDYLIQDNWLIDVYQRKKVPSDWQHNYTFTVSNTNF